MLWALDSIASWASGSTESAMTFEWHKLRAQDTDAIRCWLTTGELAPASANLALTGLRQVLHNCKRRRLMSAEDYEDATDVAPVRGKRLPPGRALSSRELAALAEVCDCDTPAGSRDAALFAVGFGAGLRRFELSTLSREDIALEPRTVRVTNGKGRLQRVVPIPTGAANSIECWLEHRGHWPGPLFVPIGRSVSISSYRALSEQAVSDICRRRALDATIGPFTPHDMRRTYITSLLEAGVDIALVQRLAGHADPATTSSYDRRAEAWKRKAADSLSIPFG